MSPAADDLIEVESDLRHLKTLIDVVTDMAIETHLSHAAATADHGSLNTLKDMLWITRDLVGRAVTSMEGATARLCEEQRAPVRMVGGERCG